MTADDEDKRFLTVCAFLPMPLLYKDVGSIPYYLTWYGWHSSIAFLSESTTPAEPFETSQLPGVELISMGMRNNRILNTFHIIKFLLSRGSNFRVVNFYHDSIIHQIYAVLYKYLSNRNGRVYIKLDMSHLELQSLLENRHRKIATFLRWFKYQLSRMSVDFYSVETTDYYLKLVDDYYYRGRLHYIPNGIACPEEVDIDQIISCKENIILTVGNLGSIPKNNELLIDAIALLDISLIKNWKVYLVGPLVNSDFYSVGYENEGTLADYVSKVVSQYPHLENTFVFTGMIEDRNKLFEIYRKAKIFCLTSRYESFGFVVPEAMYFGDYVIASDLPSVRDLTDNGRLGALFQVGDVQQLCVHLTKAMSMNMNLTTLRKDAHEFTKANVDWRVIVNKMDRIFSCR